MSAETAAKVFAERSFIFVDEPGRTAGVRIYKPEQDADGDWTCAVELIGLDVPDTQQGWGDDSAQALFCALDLAGAEVRRHPGLRPMSGQEETLGGAVENPWPVSMGPTWLPVPEPSPGEVIAERILEKLTPDEPRPAKVTVYKPVPHDAHEWRCRYVVSGVTDDGSDIDRDGCGSDSAQALFSALFLVGVAFIHQPAVAKHGGVAWDSVTSLRTEDLVPLPRSAKRLGGAKPPPSWLVELDEGVRALRALRDWFEAADEAADAPAKIEALVRGMRHLQSAGLLPVEEVDISRVIRLRALLDSVDNASPQGLLPLVQQCLLWWTRVGQSG